MAKQSGGRVTLVNVVPIMPVMMLDTVPVSYEAEVADKAQASLAETSPRRSTCRVTGFRRSSRSAASITRCSTSRRRRTPISSWSARIGRPWRPIFSDSNATAIVRHANCSVLVLRNDGRPDAAGPDQTGPMRVD